MIVSRGNRLVLYAVLAAVVALAPVSAMHVLAGRRARQRGEAELGRAADAVLERTELILNRVEEALRGLQPGVDASCPETTIANLRRTVFRDRYIRETGILDLDGRLVCTSWGLSASPPVILEALRHTPGTSGLEIRGPARTAIMGDPSIILSLPLARGGEVNALVDPEELVFPAHDFALGPVRRPPFHFDPERAQPRWDWERHGADRRRLGHGHAGVVAVSDPGHRDGPPGVAHALMGT